MQLYRLINVQKFTNSTKKIIFKKYLNSNYFKLISSTIAFTEMALAKFLQNIEFYLEVRLPWQQKRKKLKSKNLILNHMA